MITYDIPQNYSQKSFDIVNDNNAVPKMVLVAMTDMESFQGLYETTPLELKHYNLEQANLRVQGKNITSACTTYLSADCIYFF